MMNLPSYHPLLPIGIRRGGSIRVWLLATLGFLIVVGILAGLLLYLSVDDWNRDLSTNFAETDPLHADPSLRCVVLAMDLDQAAREVRSQAGRLKGWRESTGSSGANDEIKFERTTPWMRYVDDITVRLTPVEDGTRISMTSRSRVGKGDLGQNPRNIRELLSLLKRF
jgi:hypothetical protein